MSGRMNSDGTRNLLKRQVKSALRPVIGNHGASLRRAALVDALPAPATGPRAPAQPPRGGGRAGRLSPPALRRVHHLGSRRVEK